MDLSSSVFSDEDDDVMLPSKPNEGMNQNRVSADVLSLTSSLKRGLKLKDQSDTLSLSGTLKKGFRKHVLRSDSSLLLSTTTDISPAASPRNSSRFSFKSPRKTNKNGSSHDSGNVRNSKSYRGGIQDSIGRKNVVTLKKMVKLERPQGDRTDAKVLVLTPYRCQLLGVKAPFKLEHDFHFLDIKSLDSPSPQKLVVSTTSGKIFFMQMIGTDDADHVIGRIALSLRTIFPNVALSRILKASLEPLGRQKLIQQMLNQADQIEPGPCGNFSEMYRCICDYLNAPLREDVEWDVDTIYLSQNCREINCKDFDLLEIKDMIPIISVMIYNRWFDSLVIKDAKISNDVLGFILKVARNSHNLKELTISGVGLKGDFAQSLSMKLVDNKESCLEVLDLSNNPLEDKGLLHISGALPLMKHGGLRRLDFSRAGLTPRGINGLCQSLRSSPKILECLTHLNLSGNWIRGDEAEELLNFLSNQNSITDLDISNTDCSVEVFVAALSKSCVNTMKNLCIGRNHFYGRKGKEPHLPSGFQQFFKNTVCLKSLDFSGMKLPPEALGSLLDGLQSNKSGLTVELHLECCELREAGCQLLQSKVTFMKNVSKLNLTENGFDVDIIPFFDAMQGNKSIRELIVGKNFFGIKSKMLKRTMEAIVELIQEEDSCLESLSVSDSKIREHIHTLLGCLGSNTSLTTLDISGNQMGDAGARILAKSMQINSRLKIVKFDRNNLSAVGFEEMANAMQKNYALRHIPYPVSDAVNAMKSQPDRTQSALSRMQDLLLRNADENRGSNEQQFRMQRAVTNTAQKVLDKVAEKVDDAVNALEILDEESTSCDTVVAAKNLVKDAKNSKQLLSDIYGLAMERAVGDNSPLQEKLKKIAANVDKMVQEHLKDSASAMMRNAEAQCPHMFEDVKDELKSTANQRCRLPPDSIKDFILKNAGTEIVNKVSELNLTVATLISDKVTDTLLAALSQSNLSLSEQLNQCKDRPKPQIRYDDESDSIDLMSDDLDDKVENFAVETSNSDEEHSREQSQNSLLPAMRKERAESVAKRRQRPDGLSSTPEETAKKLPRTEGSPSKDLDELPTSKASPESSRSEEEQAPKEKEVVEPGSPNNKTDDHEEESLRTSEVENQQSDQEKIEEKKEPEKQEESPPQMEVEDATTANDVTTSSIEFPEVAETKTLDHVTKGRPRGPTRRTRRAPTRSVRSKPQEDSSLDGFFNNNVANTDFTAVPTTEEEEEIKRKERIEEKMSAKKIPLMGAVGSPMITPDMLKRKTRSEGSNDASTVPDSEEKSDTVAEKPKMRPKGGMGMPGMGFGGNLLAEMKLKKLSRASQDNLTVKSPDRDKTESPFGLSKLKKSPERSSNDDTNKNNSNNNNNNNNNNSSTRSSSVPFRERFLAKIKPKSDKDSKKNNEKPDAPSPKVKPLVPSNGPAVSAKPKPPPLPTKPKPPLLRSGDASKTRPLSEMFESKSAIQTSGRSRSASIEKDESIAE